MITTRNPERLNRLYKPCLLSQITCTICAAKTHLDIFLDEPQYILIINCVSCMKFMSLMNAITPLCIPMNSIGFVPHNAGQICSLLIIFNVLPFTGTFLQ
uniref:Uncharacterized protein n=1 Tax=Cacopsylla melanoneura TaxID=428564 RepID=A0A8D9AST2_9HEMI